MTCVILPYILSSGASTCMVESVGARGKGPMLTPKVTPRSSTEPTLESHSLSEVPLKVIVVLSVPSKPTLSSKSKILP